MSYVVHVWETQIPTSLTDAIQIRANLASMNKTSPLVFVKFAKNIRQMLQQACSAGEDELWPEGCPDGKSAGPVYSLGLDAEYLEYVVPVLIREASALQLIVLDEQAGAVYLPDGSHFTAAGRYQTEFAPSEPPGEQLTERQQLIDALNELLVPIMAPQGFKSLKRWSDTYAPHKRNGKACNQILFFDMRTVGSKGIKFDVQFMNEVKFPPHIKTA